MAILPRLAALAAVGVVGVALAPSPWLAFLAVNIGLLAATAVDLVRAGSPADIAVVRQVPDVVPVGRQSSLVWSLTNRGGSPARLAVADHPPPALGVVERRTRVHVPAGGAVTRSVAMTPVRRGRHRFHEVTIRLDGPWGLAARQRTVPLAGEVRAYPSFRSRREVELRLDRSRILEVGLRSAKGRGRGTDFEQLRDYTPDDDHRRIDWAATARAGRPIVRSYREERNQPVIVLVDTGRTMATRVGDVPRIEHGLDAALAVATVAVRLGDRVGLVAYDRDVRSIVPPHSGARQLRTFAEALHDLHPRLHESDPTAAFAEVLTRFPRRGLLVLIGDLDEHAVSASLLPALPLVARRHEVVIAGVRDPVVDDMSSVDPLTVADTHRQGAALDVLAGRTRVASTVRRFGVTVVDGAPRDLPGLLVDSYLRLKASGRV